MTFLDLCCSYSSHCLDGCCPDSYPEAEGSEAGDSEAVDFEEHVGSWAVDIGPVDSRDAHFQEARFVPVDSEVADSQVVYQGAEGVDGLYLAACGWSSPDCFFP